NLDFSKLQKMRLRDKTEWNYSYYPIIFDSEDRLLEVQAMLNENNVFPRRYFYPSLNTIPYVNGKEMPVSESIASRILCLPLYVDLGIEEIEKVCFLIN